MVLIADEDELLGALLCHLLGLRGVQALHCGEGDRVLALMHAWHPSAVVLDLMLPGMDGFEVLRRVRQDPRLRHTAAVILTPRTMERDVDTAMALGANRFFAKPFVPADLISTLVALDQPAAFVPADPA